MSEIFYFGSDRTAPQSTPKDFQNDVIRKVEFERFDEIKVMEKRPKLVPEKTQSDFDEDITPKRTQRTVEYEDYEVKKKIPIRYTKVKCGLRFALFIDEKNRIYSIGLGSSGELGQGKQVSYAKTLTRIGQFITNHIEDAFCGHYHAFAKMKDNTRLYGWGECSFGQLSKVKETDIATRPLLIQNEQIEDQLDESILPKPLIQKKQTSKDVNARKTIRSMKSNLSDTIVVSEAPKSIIQWKDIGCGHDFSIMVTNYGVYGCGNSKEGRLGVGNQQQAAFKPIRLKTFDTIRVSGVSCGNNHSLAWDVDGNVYGWGDTRSGKLGIPIEKGFHLNKFEIFPKRITALEKHRIIMCTCGTSHSLALSNKGKIYTWGKPESNNKIENQVDYKLLEYFTPQELTYESDKEILFVKIASGPTHNAAIDNDGRIYTWGDAIEKGLGFRTEKDIRFPKLLGGLNEYRVVDVSCGENFTYLLSVDKTDTQFKSLAHENFNQQYYSNVNETLTNIKFMKHKIKEERKNYLTALQAAKSEANSQNQHLTSPHSVADKKKQFFTRQDSLSNQQRANTLEADGDSYLMGKERNIEIEQKSTKLYTEQDQEERKIQTINQRIESLIRGEVAPTYSQKVMTTISTPRTELFTEPSTRLVSPKNINLMEFIKSSTDMISPANSDYNAQNYQNFLQQSLKNPTQISIYDNVYGKQEDFPLLPTTDDEELEVKKIEDEREKKAKLKNSKMVRGLYQELQTQNDQLKYEYINMVQSGQEEEFMKYLLTDPPASAIDNWEQLKEIRRRKRLHEAQEKFWNQPEIEGKLSRKQILLGKSKNAKQQMLDIQNKIIYLKRQMQYSSTIDPEDKVSLEKLKKAFNAMRWIYMKGDQRHKHEVIDMIGPSTTDGTTTTKQLTVDDYLEYYDDTKRRSKKLHEVNEIFQRNKDQASQKHNSPEQIQKKARKKKLMMEEALIRKKQIDDEKQERNREVVAKHSLEERIRQRMDKEKYEKYLETKRQMCGYLLAELMLKTIGTIAEKGLEHQRQQFLFSMKARLIQNTYRKYFILRTVNLFIKRKRQLLQKLVRDYRAKRRVRKVLLWYARLKMKRKLMTCLVVQRTKISNIKSFAKWIQQKIIAFRHILNHEWDRHILQNFKVKDNLGGVQSPKNNDTSGRYGSRDKIGDDSHRQKSFERKTSIMLQPDNLKFISDLPEQFISLSNEGDLNKKLMIMPSILLTTAELKVDIKFDKSSKSSRRNQPSKEKNLLLENQGQFKPDTRLRMLGRPLLPFTLDYEKLNIGGNFRINHDMTPLKDTIFEKAVKLEASLKCQLVDFIFEEHHRNFLQNFRNYHKKLKDFRKKNVDRINIERTRKMLVTPVDKLKALQKKEQFDIKKKEKNEKQELSKKRPLENEPNKSGKHHQHTVMRYNDVYENDHLPFKTLILKIAASLEDAPPRPSFSLEIKKKEFDEYFRKIYNNFNSEYQKLCREERENTHKNRRKKQMK